MNKIVHSNLLEVFWLALQTLTKQWFAEPGAANSNFANEQFCSVDVGLDERGTCTKGKPCPRPDLAEWCNRETRQVHNLKTAGSSPASAPKQEAGWQNRISILPPYTGT